MRALLKNVILIVFSIIVGFFLIEVVLHLFPQILPVQTNVLQPVVKDEFLDTKLPQNIDTVRLTLDGKPFHIKTISLGFEGIGFRDDGINDTDPFIVTIGDSFTFGHGVEIQDGWSELLEKKIGKDIVNMGMPGYSTIQSERMYERYGSKLKPNIVIYGFFANDFLDNLIFERGSTDSSRNWLYKNLMLYRLVKFIKNYYLEGRNFQTYEAYGKSFLFDSSFYYSSLFEIEGKKMTDSAKLSLSKLKNLTTENNVTLIVVFIPYREYFYQDFIQNSSLYNFNFGVTQFNLLCEELKLSCIDIRNSFESKIKNGSDVYFRPLDGHINELGNKIIADEIYDYINSHGFLKRVA